VTVRRAERAEYLDTVARLLWPAPDAVRVARRVRRRPDGEAFLLVPGAADPRLVLPAGRVVAAAAVRRYSVSRSRGALARAAVLSAALRTGFGPLLLRDRLVVRRPAGSLVGHLESALRRPLQVSLHLGPPRANRKPVLQLLDPVGEPIGFAKLGINPLTRALVEAEHAALRSLSGIELAVTVVPEVLYHGSWGATDTAVLVQSALPVWEGRRTIPPAIRLAAMREVAAHAGVQHASPTRTPWWRGLADRVDRIADQEVRTLLRCALDGPPDGGPALPFGAWHGDWTPWNMTVRRGRALVWDWERFAVGVPVGFDLVHYALQEALWGRDTDLRGATSATTARLPQLLAPFGLTSDQAYRVGALYLVEIATRYLGDGQAAAGARLGRLDRWLLPVLAELTRTRQQRPARPEGPQ
jgi:hypothetical protein